MVVRRVPALVGIVVWLVMASVLAPPVATAQQAAPPPQPGTSSSELPVSLDRIREGLEKPPVFSTAVQDALIVPTFRTRVEAHEIVLSDYWAMPTGFQPTFPGVGDLMFGLFRGVKQYRNNKERERTRQQIQDELKALEAARQARPATQQKAPPR